MTRFLSTSTPIEPVDSYCPHGQRMDIVCLKGHSPLRSIIEIQVHLSGLHTSSTKDRIRSDMIAASGRCGRKVDIDTILSASKLRGVELNTAAYNAAIGSFPNVGEYDKAVSLYKSMGTKGAKPDSVTFNVLISGCCKFGKYDEAVELFNAMIEAIDQFTHLSSPLMANGANLKYLSLCLLI